jgi:hypothetical protein
LQVQSAGGRKILAQDATDLCEAPGSDKQRLTTVKDHAKATVLRMTKLTETTRYGIDNRRRHLLGQ